MDNNQNTPLINTNSNNDKYKKPGITQSKRSFKGIRNNANEINSSKEAINSLSKQLENQEIILNEQREYYESLIQELKTNFYNEIKNQSLNFQNIFDQINEKITSLENTQTVHNDTIVGHEQTIQKQEKKIRRIRK
jgi:hypothetical protein